jgi:hypothetical protein
LGTFFTTLPSFSEMKEMPTPHRTAARAALHLALADLARSGLTRADARTLRLEVLSADQTATLGSTFHRAPALRIPYFDLDGRPTPFYRLRYLQLNGFDALVKKPVRYTQPAGSTVEVYLPPLGDRPWRDRAVDPTRAIVITEGEKKAAAATKAGFPTVGLGGVWSWRSSKKGIALEPRLASEFEWRDRLTYLVFDSDARTNPDVMSALTALARELTARGARPAIATLPELEPGRKTGLDDFLVARGKEAFAALLETAEPFALSAELWALNSEVVYVRDPGLVIVLNDGRKLAPRAFRDHAYANRSYLEETVLKSGEVRRVSKPLAPAWIAWPNRAELRKLTYAPGEPAVTTVGDYNYWRGWGVEPKRGDLRLWDELLDYLFSSDAAARIWFERWAAYPIRFPGTKLYTTAVVWGARHGTGKSLVGYTLMALYGTANAGEITDQHLGSSYNEWAENKQFIMGDDVTSGEHKRAIADRLKSMITQQYIRLNPKYIPSYTVPDCINYYFTSNHPDAFFLEDTDRRYFVFETPDDPLPLSFYQRYDAALNSPGRPLAAALLHRFRHELDLGDFNPRAPALETAAKKSMILDVKSDLGTWVYALRTDPDGVLRVGEVPVTGDLFTTTQLLALYDPGGEKRVTPNGLGRELKRAGIHHVNGGDPVRLTKGKQRLYAVRNADRWVRAAPGAIRDYYERTAAVESEPLKKKF